MQTTILRAGLALSMLLGIFGFRIRRPNPPSPSAFSLVPGWALASSIT